MDWHLPRQQLEYYWGHSGLQTAGIWDWEDIAIWKVILYMCTLYSITFQHSTTSTCVHGWLTDSPPLCVVHMWPPCLCVHHILSMLHCSIVLSALCHSRGHQTSLSCCSGGTTIGGVLGVRLTWPRVTYDEDSLSYIVFIPHSCSSVISQRLLSNFSCNEATDIKLNNCTYSTSATRCSLPSTFFAGIQCSSSASGEVSWCVSCCSLYSCTDPSFPLFHHFPSPLLPHPIPPTPLSCPLSSSSTYSLSWSCSAVWWLCTTGNSGGVLWWSLGTCLQPQVGHLRCKGGVWRARVQ